MTKQRRYLICAAVLAACVCLALGVVAMLPRDGPGVTKANFDRIKKGMTLAEVKTLLGEPMVWSVRTIPDDPYDFARYYPDGREPLITIHIEASGLGIVTHKEFQGEDETTGSKLLRWLHLTK